MKKCLGLLLIFSSLSAFSEASQTNSTTLHLRGRVPASTQIEWEDPEKMETPKVKFNNPKVRPLVEITSEKQQRKITISHP